MDKARRGCDHRRVTIRLLPFWLVASLFFVATLLSRIPTFSRSVLDWDESLYFLMAQQWRQGHLPYTTIWDNKPIGIYAIFAVAQTVFGDRVAAIRLAMVLCVSVLAFAVSRITRALTGDEAAGLVAGVALILCSLSNDGQASNTELFMACCTALAVWVSLTTEWAFLVGLLLGAAFMIKYVSIFEAPAIFFFFLARHRRPAAGLWMVLGAALPMALTALLYAAHGQLGLWWATSIASNFRRVDAPFTQQAFDYAMHMEVLRWGTMYLAGLVLLVLAAARRRAADLFLATWAVGGVVGVVAAKSFYDHYFLQLLPVLCVSLGVLFARLRHAAWLRAGFVVVALALPAWAAKTAIGHSLAPDIPNEVGAGLKGQAGSLYVFDTEPIIYALAGKVPPTRFVLPSELIGRSLPRVIGNDPVAEVARILAGAPEFIARRSNPETNPALINPTVYAEVDAAIAAHYRLWRRYPGILVFQRRAASGD
jgi:4-amino-4-deoxy-L-arabinose transferase-like glycosyltransferase